MPALISFGMKGTTSLHEFLSMLLSLLVAHQQGASLTKIRVVVRFRECGFGPPGQLLRGHICRRDDADVWVDQPECDEASVSRLAWVCESEGRYTVLAETASISMDLQIY